MNDKDLPNSIPATSMNLTEHNLEQLKALFPSVFTEGKVDFEALKAELGEYVAKEGERYQFTWAGKEQAKRIATTPSLGTLRPAPEESVNRDETENLYIEGDNLEVLKLLQKSYFNKVKMIYIDPPYNTGNDFVYKDDFKDNLANYQRLTGQRDEEGNPLTTNTDSAGRYHSNWLNMMYPRLKLARNLLRDDGVIFISIDDHEVANLRHLLNEIFGESNFVENYIWESNFRPDNSSRIERENAQHVLCYARTKSQMPALVGAQKATEGLPSLTKSSMKPSTLHFKPQWVRFQFKDGYYAAGKRSSGYVLEDDITVVDGQALAPFSLTGRMIWSQPYLEQQVKAGTAIVIKSEGFVPYSRKLETASLAPTTLIPRDQVGDVLAGNAELRSLFGAPVFNHPKPTTLLKYLIKSVTSSDHNALVLDFFAGSATTAHAIMQLNAEDSGQRKFITVQIPEPTPEGSEARQAGYATIAEIGKERIRRAANKIRDEHPDTETDLGFKVLKLDSSNIKKWQPDYDNLEQDLLRAVNNIVDGRSSEDLLYEVLIKYGLPLTLPVETLQVAGYTVYNVAGGSLVACFDEGVTVDAVQAIIGLATDDMPILRIVFRDNSFADDIIKTNAIQRFKQAGIEDVLSI